MNKVIVFDMDGTLLSSDSTKLWITESIKMNIFRVIGALLIIPFAIPLMKIKKTKRIGISLFFWVATFGLSERKLKERFENFAEKIKKKENKKIYWFSDGINELNKHLKNENKVFIVTAAPEILAKVLFESIHMQPIIIGSSLHREMGGWIFNKHCRHNEKIRRLELNGIKGPWEATYSDDIIDDYPIFVNCKKPYLINSVKNKTLNTRISNIVELNWH